MQFDPVSYADLRRVDRDDPENWCLWTLATRNAQARGDAIVAVDGTRRLSFAALLAQAERMASALAGLGIGPGDSVSSQLPNWSEALVLFLATMRLGAVANPLMPTYRRRELNHVLNQMKSKILVIPGLFRQTDYPAMVAELDAPGLEHVVVCRGAVPGLMQWDDLMESQGAPLEPPLLEPDVPSIVIYTSGTSGMPKGVVHSQRNLIFDSWTSAINSRSGSRDVGVVPSSLAHIGGVCHANIIPQILGAKMVLIDVWNPAEAARIFEREGATWMTGATPFLKDLLESPEVPREAIRAMRTFRCGGADVPPQLVRAAQAAGIDVVRCYGSTEIPTISGVTGDDYELSATTDGRIHEDVQLRVVDPEDESRILGFGELGEIQGRGAEQFLGYRDPSLNAEAVTSDGWVRMGDLGTVDAAGFVTILGRKKDIIIRKGENISAREVEDLLLEHPLVQDAAVIGLPDGERGQMVTAVLITRDGAQIARDAMTRFLDGLGVARQKYPERYEFVAAFPMTGSGKVQKAALREMFGG